MYEVLSEDRLSRRINRLVAKAERDGYDDDPAFLDMIERLYQQRAEVYAVRAYPTALTSSDLGQ